MKLRFRVIIHLLLLISAVTAAAQDSVVYPSLNCAYVKSYFTDSKAFVVSPASWRGRHWLQLGAVAGAGVLAYTQDARVQEYFAAHRSSAAGNFSKYLFEPFGDGLHTSMALGGLYAGSLIFKDKRLGGTTLTAAKSLVIATAGTQLVKHLSHRHRPFHDSPPDPQRWEGPFGNFHRESFFSGHSAAAFSVATVFAMEYRSTVWIPALAYTLAAGTAVSRLYDNKHWLSDVVVGSAFGFVTGRFIWRQSQKRTPGLVVVPQIQGNGGSLMVVLPLAASHR